MPTTRIHDINLYYESHGSGEPLLLIQGLGLDSRAWLHQISTFSQHYRVIVFDNRGIGRSDRPNTPYSTKQMAEDVVALLDTLAIESTHLLGFSLGGLIAQRIAIEYPKRVKRLLLANTTAELPAIAKWVIQGWSRLFEEDVAPETRMRLQLPWLFTEEFLVENAQVEALLDQSLQDPYPPTLNGFVGQVAACLQHEACNRLHSISVPTLILAGDRDLLIPVARSQALKSMLPNAELSILAGASHNAFWEMPILFNQAILLFLSNSSFSLH